MKKMKLKELQNKEPFFDGRGFFEKPQINLLEKILYMPIFLIVIAIRWWLKRRRK